MAQPKIFPLGDTALVCESPAPATLECQSRIWAVAAAARDWPHVVEVVPGTNNLTLVFDPLLSDAEQLGAQLLAIWGGRTKRPAAGALVEIPVSYGGACGPDLETVAKHTGLSPQQVVERHAAAEYRVFFLGFQPGFAYLGGLDAQLETPRRAEPRLAVPAGSVAIGGTQTGVYPAASPGGWQLIGRSSKVLFDPARNPPTTLQPGDRVRFTIAELLL